MLPVRYEQCFHIPGDGILHSHRRENLKSYTFTAVIVCRGTVMWGQLLSNTKLNASLTRRVEPDVMSLCHFLRDSFSCKTAQKNKFVSTGRCKNALPFQTRHISSETNSSLKPLSLLQSTQHSECFPTRFSFNEKQTERQHQRN
jgi:hypothetical protein